MNSEISHAFLDGSMRQVDEARGKINIRRLAGPSEREGNPEGTDDAGTAPRD